MTDPREAAERAATFKPGDRVLLPSGREGELVSRTGGVWTIRLAPGELLWPYRDANLIAAPSTPAEVQGGGEALARSIVEDVYLRLAQAGGEFNQDELDDCIASVLSELAAFRAAGQPEPSSMAGPVGPAKDSEPILTWHANEGWSVLAKDGARFRLVPSSVLAERKRGEGLADRLEHAADAESGSSGVLRQLCREAAAALRAAPAPVPELSKARVEAFEQAAKVAEEAGERCQRRSSWPALMDWRSGTIAAREIAYVIRDLAKAERKGGQ